MSIIQVPNRIIKPRFEWKPRHIKGHPLSIGLVGHWMFNEGAGLKAHDISGFQQNHGTLANFNFTGSSGWAPGKFGQSLSFDGVDDYVDVNRGSALYIDGAKPRSVMARIKFTSIYGGNSSTRFIDAYQADDRALYRLQFYSYDGIRNLYFVVFEPWNNIMLSASTTPSVGVWYHIVGVYNGQTMYIYINGVQENSIGVNGGELYFDIFRMGTVSGNSGWILDEARVYKRALSSQEVMWLYQQPFADIESEIYRKYWFVPTAGEEYSGAASIVGNGSIAGVIQKNGKGSVLKSAGGTLVALGVAAMLGIASISGGGSQIAIGEKSAIGSTTISTNGSIETTTLKTGQVASSISENGIIVGIGEKQGSGDSIVSGNGSLVAIGTATEAHSGIASISANGALEGVGLKAGLGVSTIQGNGEINSIDKKEAKEISLLSGNGSLEVISQKSAIESASISGNGSLIATGIKAEGEMYSGSALISCGGSLASAGIKDGKETVFVSGEGSILTIDTKQAKGLGSISGNGFIIASGIFGEAEEYFESAVISGGGSVVAQGTESSIHFHMMPRQDFIFGNQQKIFYLSPYPPNFTIGKGK